MKELWRKIKFNVETFKTFKNDVGIVKIIKDS